MGCERLAEVMASPTRQGEYLGAVPARPSLPPLRSASALVSALGSALAAALAFPLAAGCGFSGQPGGAPDAKPDGDGGDGGTGTAPPWWNTAWEHRRRLTVETGVRSPDKGYRGYTVFLSVDPAQLDARSDCRDLRVVAWDGSQWTVLPVHRLGCAGGAELRFALPVDLAAETAWRDAYLYSGNPSAPDEPVVTRDNVYRWFDDAAADHKADYQRGRMDPWNGTLYNDTLNWSSGGFYTYACPDDSQGSYRRAVDERDVLVEAEWFHTGCQLNNMQSGVCLRGIIESGVAGTEQATHYYCSSRAQNPACNDTDQDMYDGDIVKSDNELLAFNNPTDPPALKASQWRKQALAAFGTNPTELRFWDADTSWPRLAAPPQAALLASGQDNTNDHEGRGFAGLMTSQDSARFKNFVVRRYVEPEPVVSFGQEEDRP